MHDHYGKRPFFRDEVPAAKIARVIHRHPSGVDSGWTFAELAGLSEEEAVHLSVWHNEAERRGVYRAHAACSRNDPSFVWRDFEITFVPGR